MERKLGAALGVLSAAAVIFIGVLRSVPFVETLARAVVAAVAGGLIGWLVFGKLGAAVMREAAGKEEKKEKNEP